MKTLKAICTAMVLSLALSLPVFAGEMLTPSITNPVPDKPVVTQPPLGEGSSSSGAPTVSGAAEMPGLADLLMAIISIL
jgi:hypothetical protein